MHSSVKRGRPSKPASERLLVDKGRLLPSQIRRLNDLAKTKGKPRDVVKREVIEAGLGVIEKQE